MREAALSFIVSGGGREGGGGGGVGRKRGEASLRGSRPWHSQSRSYCRVSEKKGSARGVG